MTHIAHTTAKVFGTANSWSLAPLHGQSSEGQDCPIELEIQGDGKHGYHLVISPAGFFAADFWHESMDAALAAAQELFGITPKEWKKG